MNSTLLVITILAALYTYTYARWLKQNDNKIGAWGIYLLILLGLSVGVYRVMQ